MTCKLTNFVFIKLAFSKSFLKSSSRSSSRFLKRFFLKIFKTFSFINAHLISITIFILSIFFINHQQWFFLFLSSFELTFFQQHSQYQILNLVKKLMKMSENIVVLKRDTKNIFRKFSKMKKRISFLKRRIITNESQFKRFFFSFHSFFNFSFDFFFVCLISFLFHHHHYFICFLFHHHIYSFFQFICAFSFVRSFVNSFVFVFFVERIDRFRV
jgi:hypothetical protein